MAKDIREKSADDLIRFATIGAVTFSIAVPSVVVLLFASDPTQERHLLAAAIATSLYLPLYVRHVIFGLQGKRTRLTPLTLGAMAIIIVGVTPLLGAGWFYAYSALVASVLVTTSPRISLPAVACILLGVGIWASQLRNAFGVPLYGAGQSVYFPIAVADRAATVFVLVWLVGALQRVQLARFALADAAVDVERIRIDLELNEAIGIDLEEVIAKGVRAEFAVRQDLSQAEHELQSLVEGS